MSQCSISCELHDYLEIACMYGYRLKLTIKGHQTIEGKAIDTHTTAEKREYLIIDNGHEQAADRIKSTIFGYQLQHQSLASPTPRTGPGLA